jgi:hypothetical protein
MDSKILQGRWKNPQTPQGGLRREKLEMESGVKKYT